MKMKLLLCMGLLIGGIGMSLLFVENTHAATPEVVPSSFITNQVRLFAADETGDFSNGTSGNFNSSCELGNIGWIICPLTTEISKIVDSAYSFVARLLTVAPLMTTGQSANIYKAWEIMRNFANVAFVIAFMLIIFSQLTSFGLNNYGIKKMLPRLIIAAILVNASYWICALAVDVSNILGASLNGLFKGISASAALPTTTNQATIGGATVGGWAGITALVLAGSAAILYVGLSALLPALLAVVVAILTILLVLTVRQALIVLLIVISPLAFVAYLLPNTESLFKKWLAIFKTLLLMYPIIAMIFGASALASSVLLNTPVSTTNDPNQNAYQIAMQIMGALVAIIPLALTPIIMKTAGSVLGRVGAFVNNPNKGPFDRMRKGAEGYRQNRQEYRRLKAMNGYRTLPGKGMAARRKAARDAVLANRKSELSLSNAEYVADKASENGTFAKTLAQGAGQGAQVRAVASAESQLDKIHLANVDAQEAVIKNARLTPEALRTLSQGGEAGEYNAKDNAALQQAAQRRVFNTGDMEGINQLLDQSGSWNKTGDAAKDAHGAKMQQRLADTIENSKFRPAYIGQGAIAAIRDGKVATTNADGEVDPGTTSAELMKAALQNNSYSAQKIATGDKSELETVLKFVQSEGSGVTQAMKAKFSANAQTALSDPRLAAEVSKNLKVTQEIAGLVPAMPQNPPTIQNPPQQSQPQQPGVLNIPHNANPGNARTSPPPNSSGEPTRPSGLWTPEDRR
jgi:hypothetical protein